MGKAQGLLAERFDTRMRLRRCTELHSLELERQVLELAQRVALCTAQVQEQRQELLLQIRP